MLSTDVPLILEGGGGWTNMIDGTLLEAICASTRGSDSPVAATLQQRTCMMRTSAELAEKNLMTRYSQQQNYNVESVPQLLNRGWTI